MVSIIGYGRFGKVLADILSAEHSVQAYDPRIASGSDVQMVGLATALSAPTVFIAVPIRQFSDTIKSLAPHLKPGTTVIDVCSVKVYPSEIMTSELPESVDIIATHPLFGPDSLISDHRKMMMHPLRDQHKTYQKWYDFFQNQGLKILEMTPDEHDQYAANSQGITHFLGRTLTEAGFKPTPIDTLGYENLLSIVEQTCNDTWELFCDLQKYNPYTQIMTERLKTAIETIQNKSL